MTYLAIILLLIAGFALLNAWFSKPRVTIASTGDLFMLTWFYYGFSMAVDTVLGLEIPYLSGGPDFSNPDYHSTIAISLACFLMCGIAFIVSYAVTRPRQRYPQQHVTANSRCPPFVFFVVVNIGAFALLSGDFFFLSRQDRVLLQDSSLYFHSTMLLLTVIKAINVLFIILSQNRVQTIAVTIIAITLGIVSGDRSDLMIVVICLLLKFQWSTTRKAFACAVTCTVIALGCWKSVYSFTVDYVLNGEPSRSLIEGSPGGLSGIESFASHLVFATYLQNDCPYWLGKTYIVPTAHTSLPKSLRGDLGLTLSKSFTSEYYPSISQRGGSLAFSAMAEAWLNFGFFGPLLLGACWGLMAKWFDSGSRGIAFFIFAFMTSRLFRSDFASLWKSWAIIFGGSMAIACLITHICRYRAPLVPGAHISRAVHAKT